MVINAPLDDGRGGTRWPSRLTEHDADDDVGDADDDVDVVVIYADK